MPNGIDACGMLQTENVKTPTQWIVVDVTPDLRHRTRFVGVDGIDYLPAYARDEGAGVRALIDSMRPALLAKLRNAVESRIPMGYQGRQIIWYMCDPNDEVSRKLAAELPLHVSQSLFWSLNLAPAVIRAGATTDAAARTAFLEAVAPQYFAMADFSEPYSARRHEPGTVYGSLFDSVLLAREPREIEAILDVLVPYHIEETRAAMIDPGKRTSGGQVVIDDAMNWSRTWRKIDWLTVAMYPYFLRLWDTAKDDILEVLDFTRCAAERDANPWAAAQKRRREASWTHLGIETKPWTGLIDPDQPYNVTPGDFATRQELIGFLRRMNCHEEALDQCNRAIAEGGVESDPNWLKRKAIALIALHRQDEARPVFAALRARLEQQPEPTADVLYEIAMSSELSGDPQAACNFGMACLKVNPGHIGAHQLIRALAHANGLIDLYFRSVELAKAAGVEVPDDETAGPPPGARPPASAPQAAAPVAPRSVPMPVKPVRPRERFEPAVWDQIKLIPYTFFARVAMADGAADDKEIAKHRSHFAKADAYSCPVARDLFSDIKSGDDSRFMNQAVLALATPGWTQGMCAALKKALSSEEYESFAAVLFHNAQEIAAASGGYFGIFGNKVSTEERAVIDGIAKELGVREG